MPDTHHVVSKDGTRIAFSTRGAGPPLVLVHGTLGWQGRWRPVLPALAEHFRVVCIDRRGRGESTDGPSHSLAREAEDVAAVVDSLDEPTRLLGHSYGALCALEAALIARNLDRLVLYEPALPLGNGPLSPPGGVERLQALLAEGDRDGAIVAFLREFLQMPEPQIAAFRGSDGWKNRVAAAHTLPRELLAEEHYHLDPRRFQHLTVPTLLLLGGDSLPMFHAITDALDKALPASHVVVLPGQQHIAMDTAPELFAREVSRFLAESGGPTTS